MFNCLFEASKLNCWQKTAIFGRFLMNIGAYGYKVLYCFQHFLFDVLPLLLVAGDGILLVSFDIENVLMI